jgi:hypothetical protein
MVECVGTLSRKRILFQKHWDDRGSGQRLVHDWFERGSQTEDPFESFIYVWFAFNGWAETVTEEERDFLWLEILGVEPRLRAEFQEAVDSDKSVREAVDGLHAFAPIFRSVEQRKVDPPPRGEREDHIKYWLSKKIDGKPLAYRPRCYEDDVKKTGRIDKDWPHILQAIYGVRCNLFHGGKSTENSEDFMLVAWGRAILVGFLSKGGYLGYRDPKS